MKRTLDEGIKYYSDLAEENEKDAEQFKRLRASQDMISHCLECAKEHRQLADWLRELKALLGAEEEIRGMRQVWEEGVGIQKCIDILDKWHGEVQNDA